ncbi:MAG: YeiH family protein [Lachnospiraceae bacterium]|nr:YeiH family protein [Lachnospiraceae bacterium]
MNKLINFIKTNWLGILVCFLIALPSWFIGEKFPIIGGPVIAILSGMVITLFWSKKKTAQSGIKFTSKFILQAAVVLLGFGLNLNIILETGKQSLPIIICTISTSLFIAFALHKAMNIPGNISILVGVGSSICGGSAIAATAPVIDADDDEVAQAISVIFFFNVLAALFFPLFGSLIGFNTSNGEAFGIFSGTAVNDTSSVTATASTWDSMWNLGTQTLDKAVTVKLTRTLAIIPITLALAIIRAKKAKKENGNASRFSLKKSFPFFIIYFIIASLITTIAVNFGVSQEVFAPIKELSKFCIIMAMAAIGLNSNIIKLVKSGGKPILLGGLCWIGITAISLLMQHVLGIW